MSRITSKAPFCLITDDDGHDYLIPWTEREDFYRWCQTQYDCELWEGRDYNQDRIDGQHVLKIYQWEISS